MPRMRDAKILGALGYGLILLGIATPLGVWLVLVGWVLSSVAVKYVSETVGDISIFINWIAATTIKIIGLGGAAIVAGVAMSTLVRGVPSAVFSLNLVTLVVFLLVIWIASVIGAVFERRAYNRISDLTKVDLFWTAGIIAIVGAITMMILVGIILIFMNVIVVAVAFFSLPDEYSPSLPPPPP